MNKLLILPMFFLTMCGTAPVTPPAGAFELEVEETHWNNVYRAIEYIKANEREKNMTDPDGSCLKYLDIGDPNSKKSGFNGADDIADWFKNAKSDDWRQRD